MPIALAGRRGGEAANGLSGREAEREFGRRGLIARRGCGGEGGRGVWVEDAETKLSFDDSETAVGGRAEVDLGPTG